MKSDLESLTARYCSRPSLRLVLWLLIWLPLQGAALLVLPSPQLFSEEPNVSEQHTDSTVTDTTERPPTPSPRSLAARIDLLLQDQHPLLTAPRDADGTLLRRLSLDLRGVVPTQVELDEFSADTSPQRWSVWVERFLADPLCDEHLVQVLDRMLMMRRSYTQVDRAAWLSYLREQVANNTPLDQLTQQLLASPWWHRENRAAQRFYLDRGGDPNLIARDLGRVFLGRDLQCAQCHDHPQIDDYRQTDYHGLLAFVAPSKLADAVSKDAEGKDVTVQLYVELPAGDAPFESVFNTGVPYRSGPRLPEQIELLEEFVLPDQRLQSQAPADALAGAPIPPQHSRRQLLAQQLTARSNSTFVSNWANRWWAQLFGQGLVHPVDMQHVDNPPSHPELYQLISRGLLEVEMQPRQFLAQLVQTNAYQRSGWTTLQASNNAAVPLELSAEQSHELRQWTTTHLRELVDSQTVLSEREATAQATYDTAIEAWEEVQAQRAAARAELDPAEAILIGEQKKATDAANLLSAAEKTQTEAHTQATLLEEAQAKLQQAAMVSGQEDPALKPAIDATNQPLTATREKLPGIDQQVVDARAARDASVAAMQAAKLIVEQIVVRLQPIQQALQAADTRLLAARSAWHQAYWGLADSKRRSECHLHTLAWLDCLMTSKETSSELWSAVNQDAIRNLSVARLSPLSPEQLCWSILRITGQLDNYTQVELAELEKASPLAVDADASARRGRQQQAVRAAFDKLRGYTDIFVSLYASGPDKTQDDFFASADQALYTANSGSVFVWAGPGAPVTHQAIETSDDALVAKELYGCLLCRPPTDAETELVKHELVGAGEGRAAVIQEMVWGLLASAEFRFSY